MQNQQTIKEICKPYLAKNAHHETMVYNSKGVVCKRGNIHLELTESGLVLTNGWCTNWVILYGFNSRWAADSHAFTGNKIMRQRLDRIATKYTEEGTSQKWNTIQSKKTPHNGTMPATTARQNRKQGVTSALPIKASVRRYRPLERRGKTAIPTKWH